MKRRKYFRLAQKLNPNEKDRRRLAHDAIIYERLDEQGELFAIIEKAKEKGLLDESYRLDSKFEVY